MPLLEYLIRQQFERVQECVVLIRIEIHQSKYNMVLLLALRRFRKLEYHQKLE